jgi:hypothetical protein
MSCSLFFFLSFNFDAALCLFQFWLVLQARHVLAVFGVGG